MRPKRRCRLGMHLMERQHAAALAAILCLALFGSATRAADCPQLLHLNTQSLGEVQLPLTEIARQAKSQKLSYLQEVDIPVERCMFQGGIRNCTLRPDTGYVGFTLEMRGDVCELKDSYITGSETRSIGGKPMEIPRFEETHQKFACSSLLRCR